MPYELHMARVGRKESPFNRKRPLAQPASRMSSHLCFPIGSLKICEYNNHTAIHVTHSETATAIQRFLLLKDRCRALLISHMNTEQWQENPVQALPEVALCYTQHTAGDGACLQLQIPHLRCYLSMQEAYCIISPSVNIPPQTSCGFKSSTLILALTVLHAFT